MICKDLTHDLLIEYLVHNLDRNQLQQIRYHLTGCTTCPRRLEEVRSIMGGIAAMNQGARPGISQAAEDALLVEISQLAAAARGEAPSLQPEVSLATRRRPVSMPVVGALAAAALFLLALVGVVRSTLLGDDPAAVETATELHVIDSADDPAVPPTPTLVADNPVQPPQNAVAAATPSTPVDPVAGPAPAAVVQRPNLPDGGSIMPVFPEEPPGTLAIASLAEQVPTAPKPIAAPDAVATRPTGKSAAPVRKRGDVNGDGRVDIADSMLITRAVVRGDVTLDVHLADVNGDGKVDVADSMVISNQVVGGAQ